MKDGYYYFISAAAEKNEYDKSLGYICISKSPGRNYFSIQCSLNKERAVKLANARRPIEIYLSPVTYITNGSFAIGKFSLGQKGRLFLDSSLPVAIANSFNENQYIIITAGERTIYYSEIYRKPQHEITVPPPAQTQHKEEREYYGKEFDPFDTANSAYKWFIHESLPNAADSLKNIGDLEKLLRKFNVQHELFAKMDISSASISSDTFLKTAYHSLQVAGHILRGEYSDPQSLRCFTVIGLPGLNVQNSHSARNGRRPSLSPASIRRYARWLAARQKPTNSYNRNYNGYWLYYFDAESGAPVKAVMKNT